VKDSKESKTPKKEIITVQANDFIQKASYKNFDTVDIKIFKTILGKINHNDTLFKDFYIIDYEDLDEVNIDKKNRFAIVTKSLKKLANYYVQLEQGNSTVEVGLIQNKFKYEKNSSKIVVSVHEDLKPFLLDLSVKYTKYGIANLALLKNVYSIKLFELLKSFQALGYYETTIANLRKSLEIPEDNYKMYADLKKKVIEKAQREIASTTIYFDFKEEKIGKKVERIIFTIKSYEEKIDLDQYKGKNIKFKLKPEDEEETLLFVKDIIKLDSGYEIKLINLDIGGAINMNAPRTEEELFNWFKKIVIKDSK
jgi:plasmid replication initiation protein